MARGQNATAEKSDSSPIKLNLLWAICIASQSTSTAQSSILEAAAGDWLSNCPVGSSDVQLLLRTGLMTGLVLDSGDGVTHAVSLLAAQLSLIPAISFVVLHKLKCRPCCGKDRSIAICKGSSCQEITLPAMSAVLPCRSQSLKASPFQT